MSSLLSLCDTIPQWIKVIRKLWIVNWNYFFWFKQGIDYLVLITVKFYEAFPDPIGKLNKSKFRLFPLACVFYDSYLPRAYLIELSVYFSLSLRINYSAGEILISSSHSKQSWFQEIPLSGKKYYQYTQELMLSPFWRMVIKKWNIRQMMLADQYRIFKLHFFLFRPKWNYQE